MDGVTSDDPYPDPYVLRVLISLSTRGGTTGSRLTESGGQGYNELWATRHTVRE